MDSTPINQFAATKGAQLEPPNSLIPILIPGYEFCPCFIHLVRKQSFAGEEDESLYVHLREFKQVCSCLRIAGISQELKVEAFSVLFDKYNETMVCSYRR